MKNTNDNPQFVYEREGGVEIAEAVRAFEVSRYRTRLYDAGPLLDIEAYPIFKLRKEATRANKAAKTNKAQKEVNKRNAGLLLDRIVALNFVEHIDLKIVLDYFFAPLTAEEAQKHISDWIKLYRKECRKRGVEPKSIYIPNWLTKTGRPSKRPHNHVVVTACGMDMYEILKLWPHGRTHVEPLQPDKFGVIGLSRYLTEHLHGAKRWVGSRNLIKPEPEYPSKPLCKTQASKLAANFELARSFFEDKYPTHIFLTMEVRTSEFVTGAYILVRMRRRDAWIGQQPKKRWKGAEPYANMQGVRRGNRVHQDGGGQTDAGAAGGA